MAARRCVVPARGICTAWTCSITLGDVSRLRASVGQSTGSPCTWRRTLASRTWWALAGAVTVHTNGGGGHSGEAQTLERPHLPFTLAYGSVAAFLGISATAAALPFSPASCSTACGGCTTLTRRLTAILATLEPFPCRQRWHDTRPRSGPLLCRHCFAKRRRVGGGVQTSMTQIRCVALGALARLAGMAQNASTPKIFSVSGTVTVHTNGEGFHGGEAQASDVMAQASFCGETTIHFTTTSQ